MPFQKRLPFPVLTQHSLENNPLVAGMPEEAAAKRPFSSGEPEKNGLSLNAIATPHTRQTGIALPA